jgi:hypothetical protein
MNVDVTKAMSYTAGGKDWALVSPDVDLAQWAINDIRIRLTTFKGQYLFDQNAGVDWLKLFERGIELEIREAIRFSINTCPAVSKLEEITSAFDISTRKLSVNFTALLSNRTRIQSTEQI